MQIDKVHIDGCKKGVPSAQRAIYDCLLPYLNMLSVRYLKKPADRQDVLQESFIKIFSKIDQFDAEKGRFQAWAAKILINCCLQHNAKTINRAEEPISAKEYSLSIQPDIIDQLSDEDLLLFLKRMPENYYQVFNLFIIEGFSHQEIAELLGVSEALSRKWLSRAREWLKKKLSIDNEFYIQLKLSNN